MPTPTPHDIAWFGSATELREWLREHHQAAAECWVGRRRKGSGIPSLTWEELVDEVLCVGWIDSVVHAVEGGSAQRITPRRRGSTWSARNVGRVEALRAEGRMLPAGEAAFALRRDDRTAVYSFEREATLDEDAVEALRAAGGLAFFEAQSPSYRRAAAGWVMSAKRPATRAKRLRAVVDASAAGRRAAELVPPARRTQPAEAGREA